MADSHFACGKPFLAEVSLGAVDPTAQPKASKGSPIAQLIDEKNRVEEVVFLAEAMENRAAESVP